VINSSIMSSYTFKSELKTKLEQVLSVPPIHAPLFFFLSLISMSCANEQNIIISCAYNLVIKIIVTTCM
jgi:hypothetical protein